MNERNLGVKIIGADEALKKLDALHIKLEEVTLLITEINAMGIKIDLIDGVKQEDF